MCSVQYTMCSAQYRTCSVQFMICTVQYTTCALYNTWYALYKTQHVYCTIHNKGTVQYTCALNNIHHVHWKIHMCTVYYTTHALYNAKHVYWTIHCQLLLLVDCLTSQQHAGISQGRICSDKFTCCHTETEVAVQTFYLTQSQNTATGLTSPSTDPVMPGTWQVSHWSANC